jgi:hypothetical protein
VDAALIEIVGRAMHPSASGLLWEWLPKGALDHDPNAYSKSDRSGAVDRPPQKPDLCNIGGITVTEAGGIRYA